MFSLDIFPFSTQKHLLRNNKAALSSFPGEREAHEKKKNKPTKKIPSGQKEIDRVEKQQPCRFTMSSSPVGRLMAAPLHVVVVDRQRSCCIGNQVNHVFF